MSESLTAPTRNPRFVSRLLPDGTVLVHEPNSSSVTTLSAIGGMVWEFCDGHHTASQIAEKVSQLTQLLVSVDDVTSAVEQMRSNKLLDSDC